MTDNITKAQRSAIMSKVRAKNTLPELTIRSGLFKKGFRFRIHSKKLPGCPDIVLPKYSAVIFVHGCFWHGHLCKAGKLPATNIDFWKDKISKNKERDLSLIQNLNKLGWKVLIVWECSLKGVNKTTIENLIDHMTRWIEKGKKNKEILGLTLKNRNPVK